MLRCSACSARIPDQSGLLGPDLCDACFDRDTEALVRRVISARSSAVATAELLTSLRRLGFDASGVS